MTSSSRRTFLRRSAATALGLTVGPRLWAWTDEATASAAPFGPLQPDPLLKLPEGFSYQVVAETGMPLAAGSPYVRPNFPDLNVVFPQPDGTALLSTSHEVPPIFPLLTPPPTEDYDAHAGGAITTLRVRRVGEAVLAVEDGIYNAGGMLANCSGSGTPWGTVLTGEEDTTGPDQIFEAEHGFVWEVDPESQGKVKIPGMGRFDHETAVVGPDGNVYLTEDAGTGYLYRYRPTTTAGAYGDLAGGGILEVFAAGGPKPTAQGGTLAGRWETVADPADISVHPDAVKFRRLEGGAFDPQAANDFVFAETADPQNCGAMWRLDVSTATIELWVASGDGSALCMPDNIAFDAAGNAYLTEDKANAGFSNPNRVVFVDRSSGLLHTFAELVQYWQTPDNPGNVADEPTGPAFWNDAPGGPVLFLNLQRAMPTIGLTVAITGPFPTAPAVAGRPAVPQLG